MFDEQLEQDKFVQIVGGIKRADRLQQIHRMSAYSGFGKTAEENFISCATGEGFSRKAISTFLKLR